MIISNQHSGRALALAQPAHTSCLTASRAPTGPMNAPELTSALSVKVLPNKSNPHSSTRSCRRPTRRTSTPSGSMDAQVTPATGPTRQTTYGGVTEPSNKLRRNNLHNMVFCHSAGR